MTEMLAALALVLALLPLALALRNLALYRKPQSPPPAGTAVSILIPARDEERNIERAVGSALASEGVEVEVVVLDDHSGDRTAAIVRAMAERDPRLRLETAPPLPPGWSGKQHACHALGQLARHPLLLFVDADVRLAPGAVAGAAGFLQAQGAALVSGFPRQVTGSFLERLVIPLIHLLLLGYLPLDLTRRRKDAGFAAGCGQLIMVRREAYDCVGGHAAIRHSLHDGIMLPRAFRRAGFMTDLFDATDLAACRMYDGARAVWEGFSKNATEGMATLAALPLWTLLLFGGHVLPWLLLPLTLMTSGPALLTALAAAGVAANLLLRTVLVWRFRQSWLGAVLHPVAVSFLLVLQWQALAQAQRGRPAIWRGRSYPAA